MKPRLKSSAAARDLIKAHEPFVARAIRRGRRWVVGYGHTAAAREGVTLKPEDAELLLLYDVLQAERAIDDALGEGVSGDMRDALVSFACSIGPKAFRSSDVALHAREARHRQAAAAIETWVRAEEDGRLVVSERLVRRRAAEKALYLKGVSATGPLAPPAAEPDSAPAPVSEPSEPDAVEEAGEVFEAPAASGAEATLVELDLIFETPERPAPTAPPKALPADAPPEPAAPVPAAPQAEADLDAPQTQSEPDAAGGDASGSDAAGLGLPETPDVVDPLREHGSEPQEELEADAEAQAVSEAAPQDAHAPGAADPQPAPVDTSAQDDALRRVMAQMAAAMGEGVRSAPVARPEAEAQTSGEMAEAPAEADDTSAGRETPENPAEPGTPTRPDLQPEAADAGETPDAAPVRSGNDAPVQLSYNFLRSARVAARPLNRSPAAITTLIPGPAADAASDAPAQTQDAAGVSGEAQGPLVAPAEEHGEPPVRKVPSIARRTPPHPAEGPAEAEGVSGEVGGVGRPEEFEAEDAEIHANDALDPFLVAGAEAEHGFKAEEEKPIERNGGDWVFGAYLAVGVALAGVGGWDLMSNLEVYREEGFIYFGPLAFAAGFVLSLASLWFIIGRMFSGGNGAQRG